MKKRNYTYNDIRKDIEKIDVSGDEWLTEQKEILLKECDEAIQMSAETQKILSDAKAILASDNMKLINGLLS